MFGSTQASQSQSPWATTSTGANATTSAFGGGGTSAFGAGGTGTTSQSAFGGGGTSAFGAGGTGNTSQSAFGGGGTSAFGAGGTGTTSQSAFGGGGTSAFGAGGTGTTSQSAFGGSGTATSGLGGAGTSSSAFGGALKRPSGFGLPSSTLLGGGSGTTSASSPSGTGGIFGSSAIRPGGTGILTPSSSSITQPEHILMKHTYADLPQAAKSEIKALEEMMRGEHNRMNQLGLEYDSWSSAPALALREDMKELSTAHKKLHASITNMCTAVEELKQQVVFEGRYVDYGESLVKGGQLGPQIVASGTGSVLSGYLKAFSKDLSRRRMQGEEKTEQLATYFQSILPSLNSESGLFQEDDLQMTQPAPEDLERWLGDIHNTLRRVAGRISRSDEEVKRVAKEHTNMRKLFYGASGILDPVPSKIPVLEEEKEGKDLVRSFARKWLKREDSQPAALGQAAGASTSALGTTGGRPGGIFGSSALGTTGTTGSALGSLGASSLQSTFGQNVQTGKSAFGVGSTGTSAFGGGATGTSAFGGGATGTSAFGAGATGTSAFGGGSTGTTAFGGGSTRTSAFCGGATGTSAFGGGSTGTTAFGGGSTRTSAFGGGATGTSAFGAGSTSTPAAASSAFGAASSTPNPSAVGGGSAFGKTVRETRSPPMEPSNKQRRLSA